MRAVLLVLAACGTAAPQPATFAAQPLATEPGLSGLAVGERGDAWTITERAQTAYRVSLADPPALEAFAIVGAPDGHDLESIAVLGPGVFAIGTEARVPEPSRVLFARRDGRRLVIGESVVITSAEIGIPVEENHGVEGLCGVDRSLAAALESVGVADGRRWAPVVRIEGGAVVRTHRLWLTSTTGKLSSLDCRRTADGSLDVLAIERDFAVTRVLRFALGTATDVTPRIARDLSAAIHGRLNLEGIAWLPGGDVVAVTDNQWKVITGPSLLLRLGRL